MPIDPLAFAIDEAETSNGPSAVLLEPLALAISALK